MEFKTGPMVLSANSNDNFDSLCWKWVNHQLSCSYMYDTTFQLGDFYVLILCFRHTLFKETPVIPATFLVHERNLSISKSSSMTVQSSDDLSTTQHAPCLQLNKECCSTSYLKSLKSLNFCAGTTSFVLWCHGYTSMGPHVKTSQSTWVTSEI